MVAKWLIAEFIEKLVFNINEQCHGALQFIMYLTATILFV